MSLSSYIKLITIIIIIWWKGDCNNDCEPQGLIPTPEEEEELRLMNEPLFNSIPGVFDFETNETNGAVSSL